MSRCFPFPPSGYEKKARTDDVNLLKKEKQKEKKHKKEKKDKEKRENKEKKEKDRSDGKHKDKKDKKEKHKDNKKEKDRDKEKEKDRSNNSEKKFPAHPDGQNGEQTSDEKKLPGKSEGQSGEKFIQKEKGRDKDRSSFSGEKKLAGQFSGYNGEKSGQNSRDKDRSSFSVEKKLAGQFSGYNGEKSGQNSHLPEDFRDSKFVQELGRTVRDEGAGAGKQLADKFMGTDWKRDEGMVRLVGNTANTLAEQKEKNKRSDDRKLDVQGIREETKSGGNAMVQNLAGAVKARVERIPRKVENNIERQGEGKEKTEEKESDDKIKDKRKDRHRDKKSHGKHKDRDKEKEEKAKAKDEHRHLEQDNLKASNKDDPVGILDLKTSRPFREGNKGALAEENLHKRKDLEKNGFFHVDDIKPNKLPRISSSHPLTDNGRTLETCQAPNPLTSDSQGAGNSHKVNNKDRKVNGIIEAKLLSVSPTKHLSASPQATQIDEVSIKPPHPDLKFLSQVLSVPKMEEWSDFDDQSWLFHSNESQSKKLKVGFSEIDESQVWAEALRIQSADVCALPYVIPY